MHLVEQARRGLDLTKATQADHAQLVSQLYQLQQQRLADAFDADVREKKDFSVDWIIEHRKAYAAALSAVQKQQALGAEVNATALRNLGAVDAALQRVLTLQALQLKITSLDGILPDLTPTSGK